MSGGVDSSVAAALLKEQGYECVGVFLKLWSEAEENTKRLGIENKCCSIDSFNDARRIAHQLGFPIYTINVRESFKEMVVDQWLESYRQGKTPNPCINCNRLIRFKVMLKRAEQLGCDYLATGHYVKLETDSNGLVKLISGDDKNKDQSYFLYTMTQDRLKKLMFPVGHLTKPVVREIAKKFNLEVHKKPESQEICFISEKTHYSFLKRHLDLKSGLIKDINGQELGRHDGLALYTLGQRHGIKIGGPGGPYYVVKLDHKTNTLYVSNNANDPLIMTTKFKIKDATWISGTPPGPTETYGVKIRHQAQVIPAAIDAQNVVTLAQPARAIMIGQAAVFYKDKQVLGGGLISKIDIGVAAG